MGLKYCGGCRAGYDREKVVNRLKETLNEHVEYIAPDSEDAESILIVSGCTTACVDVSQFSDRPIRIITSEEDAGQWCEEMMQSQRLGGADLMKLRDIYISGVNSSE